ncbi:MAG: HAD family phosphatase [Epsilonproteobacteria bacterium]|nr:HAD family phosphatase [Campylobacterota bacterium]
METIRFKAVVLAVCSLTFSVRAGDQAAQKAVIFDIGGVLAASDKLQAFKATGPHHFFYYFSANPCMISGSTEKIRNQLLYPFLRSCMPYTATDCFAYDEFGQRLPQLMVEWMTGRLSCRSLRAICKENCALYSSWFVSPAERDLMYGMTMMMFTPHHLANTQQLLYKSLDFVRACKASGYKLYILSNWDSESFPELVKKDPDLFALFDGIVISGDCGYVKPDPAIYRHLLNTYNLDPHDTFFIDDVIQNVHAARDAGMTAAQCMLCDIDSIKSAFHAWQNA